MPAFRAVSAGGTKSQVPVALIPAPIISAASADGWLLIRPLYYLHCTSCLNAENQHFTRYITTIRI